MPDPAVSLRRISVVQCLRFPVVVDATSWSDQVAVAVQVYDNVQRRVPPPPMLIMRRISAALYDTINGTREESHSG